MTIFKRLNDILTGNTPEALAANSPAAMRDERDGGRSAEIERRKIDAHAVALQAIKQAEVKLIELFPARMAHYQERHDADKSAYHFEARRHGDFLTLVATRLDGPYRNNGDYRPRESSWAVRVTDVETVILNKGHEPSLTGSIGWQYDHRDGTIDTPEEYDDFRSPLHHYAPAITTPDGLFGGSSYRSGRSYRSTHDYRTPNAPRKAQDDTIVIGKAVVLSIPAGLGQATYDALIKALARGSRRTTK